MNRNYTWGKIRTSAVISKVDHEKLHHTSTFLRTCSEVWTSFSGCSTSIIRELKKTQRRRKGERHLKMYAHVLHTTAKQVISRRRKNENVFKMSKNEKCTCKACKNTVFPCQICTFVGFLLPRGRRRRGCLSSLFNLREQLVTLILIFWRTN